MDLGLKERDRISVLRQAYEGLVTVSGGAERPGPPDCATQPPLRCVAAWNVSLPRCQWPLKMSHFWPLKMSHFAG